MRLLGQALASLLLLLPAAFAQSALPEREVEIVRSMFEVGNYKEALERCRDVMAKQSFSEPQRMDLNKYAGISAFVVGDEPSAERHLLNLLELNPDYVLDPFAFPPPAISFFEELRKKNAEALNLVRQKLALREEQARKDAAERERQRLAAEEQRRRLEQLSAKVTVRTVERRSYALNFVPFGAGQFQQGRSGTGVALASAQGVLGATSVIAYLAIESLKQERQTLIKGLEGNVVHTDFGIPAERLGERDAWRWVKYGSGAAFYAVWAAGVVDALAHHQDQVVTTEDSEAPPSASPQGSLRPLLFPTPGGAGAGVHLSF